MALTEAEQRELLIRTLKDIRDVLVEYQRDEDAVVFRNSHKCRRLCEEALGKCSNGRIQQ
jgi:hypothetical protein